MQRKIFFLVFYKLNVACQVHLLSFAQNMCYCVVFLRDVNFQKKWLRHFPFHGKPCLIKKGCKPIVEKLFITPARDYLQAGISLLP